MDVGDETRRIAESFLRGFGVTVDECRQFHGGDFVTLEQGGELGVARFTVGGPFVE